jgi:hypothetical protein
MENPQSSELAESPKTTPPNNPCQGIGSAGEDRLVVTLLNLNPKVFLDEHRW